MAKFVLKDPLTFSKVKIDAEFDIFNFFPNLLTKKKNKKVMKIMSQLVEEIEILIDAKGWSVVTMDCK